jgi:hypothetical protein
MPSLLLRLINFTITLTTVLTVFATPVIAANDADPKWYQVEIILFAREQNNLPATEQWRVEFNPLYPENTVVLIPYNKLTKTRGLPVELPGANATNGKGIAIPIDIDKDPYIILPSDKWQLSKEALQLSRASGYKVLEHLAWRQPVSARENSQPILIQTGNQYGLNFEVEGLITISLNRYLHVDTDLLFSKFSKELFNDHIDWSLLNEAPHTGSGKTASKPGISFQNTESNKADNGLPFQEAEQQYRREFATSLKHIRRVRNDELHYIDHPLFGLIVKLTPYQLPDPAMDLLELDPLSLPQLKTMPEVL